MQPLRNAIQHLFFTHTFISQPIARPLSLSFSHPVWSPLKGEGGFLHLQVVSVQGCQLSINSGKTHKIWDFFPGSIIFLRLAVLVQVIVIVIRIILPLTINATNVFSIFNYSVLFIISIIHYVLPICLYKFFRLSRQSINH